MRLRSRHLAASSSRHPLRAAAAVAALLLTLTACSSSDDTASDDTASNDSSGDTSSSPAPDSSAPATESCEYPADGSQAARDVDPPAAEPTASGDVAVTISLNAGDVNATLDGAATPCTVNSFLSLASQGYYDDTNCHRLTTQGIYVLQCGDPTESGAGGPGYAFADELSGTETYPAGTLAMANAGPNTNGSQFFIVYEDTQLPPSYAVFGSIDEASIKTVAAIAAKGTADGGPDGAPKQTVTISSVTEG